VVPADGEGDDGAGGHEGDADLDHRERIAAGVRQRADVWVTPPTSGAIVLTPWT
jgi:hypothetical protein